MSITSCLSLGRKTLRWVGVMDSDRMFEDMYAQYYLHEDNRWASFVIGDELQQVPSLLLLLRDNESGVGSDEEGWKWDVLEGSSSHIEM